MEKRNQLLERQTNPGVMNKMKDEYTGCLIYAKNPDVTKIDSSYAFFTAIIDLM